MIQGVSVLALIAVGLWIQLDPAEMERWLGWAPWRLASLATLKGWFVACALGLALAIGFVALLMSGLKPRSVSWLALSGWTGSM